VAGPEGEEVDGGGVSTDKCVHTGRHSLVPPDEDVLDEQLVNLRENNNKKNKM
jgi:hypothetical protein